MNKAGVKHIYNEGKFSSIERNPEEEKTIIYSNLEHLKGLNFNKEKILTDNEFKRLLKSVNYLVSHDDLPENTAPFKLIGISSNSIKYTFYCIHKEIFTTNKIHDSFINFLKVYFQNIFSNWDQKTIKIKFSVKPKNIHSKH